MERRDNMETKIGRWTGTEIRVSQETQTFSEAFAGYDSVEMMDSKAEDTATNPDDDPWARKSVDVESMDFPRCELETTTKRRNT